MREHFGKLSLSVLVIILLFDYSASAVIAGPLTPPTNIPVSTHFSAITAASSDYVIGAQPLAIDDIFSDKAIDEKEFPYLSALISPETLNFNQEVLSSSRRGYSLVASAVKTESSFIQQQLIAELSKLEGAELVNLFGFLPGIRFSYPDGGKVFIFSHISQSPALIVFSETKDLSSAYDRESQTRLILNGLNQELSGLYEHPSDWKGILREFAEAALFPDRTDSLTEEEARVLSNKVDEYMAMLLPQSMDAVSMLTPATLESGDYNPAQDTWLFNLPKFYVDLEEDYSEGELRTEPGEAFVPIPERLSIAFSSAARDMRGLESIRFSLQFSPEHYGESGDLIEPIKTLLVFELSDSAGRKSTARIDARDYITEGDVVLNKDSFTPDEGFSWAEVTRADIYLEYQISNEYIDTEDKFELKGLSMSIAAQSPDAILGELQEKALLRELFIRHWFGGNRSVVNNALVGKLVDAALLETAGGLIKGEKSLYEVMADIACSGGHLRFLAQKSNLNIKAVGSLDMNAAAGREIFDRFTGFLREVLSARYGSGFDSMPESVFFLQLSDSLQNNFREDAWRSYVSDRQQAARVASNSEAAYLKDVLAPLLKSYLGLEDTGTNEDFGRGSYLYNALYWLGSQLGDKVSFTGEEQSLIDREVELRIRRLQDNYGIQDVTSSTRAEVREDVETDFALRKIYNEMSLVGEPISIDNFINWITKNYTEVQIEIFRTKFKESEKYTDREISRILSCKYSMQDIQTIEARLYGITELAPSVAMVIGRPSVQYLQQVEDMSIGSKDFIELQLQALADLIIFDFYVEIDADRAVLLDAAGGVHANVAAMGMGIELIAALTQAGVIDYTAGEEMCRKLMNSILYIREQQPKGEWVNQLLGKYPMVLLERLAGRADLRSIDLIGIVSELEAEGKIPQGKAKALRDDIEKGVLSITDEDIKELSRADLPEQLDLIKKYGWGGWLYHFVNTYDLARSDEYVEISSADTLEYDFYASYGVGVFPALEDLFRASFNMLDVDNPLLWRGDANSYRLHWTTDLNRESDYRGFEFQYSYHGDERMIIDYTRILRHAMERGAEVGDFSDQVWSSREAPIWLSGIGMQIPVFQTHQMAGWTKGWFRLNIGLGLTEAESEYTMYQESQEALYAIHIYAMRQGYLPWEFGPCQSDTKNYGFQMEFGIPELALGGDITHDKTASFYSWAVANPFLADWATRREYTVQPKSFQGNVIPYDSVNTEQDFYSPTRFLLNLAYYGIGLINRYQNGLIHDTYKGISFVQDANRAAGFSEITAEEYSPSSSLEGLIEVVRSGNIRDISDLSRHYTLDQAYDTAEDLVSHMVELAYISSTRRDEYGLSAYGYYLDNEDNFYSAAGKLLEYVAAGAEGEMLVKALALSFVVDVNRHYYISQRDKFNGLVAAIGDSKDELEYLNYMELAAGIISDYHYEARVIFKDYDPETGLVPVLSREDILEDLNNYPSLGRTWCVPELEDYLSSNVRINPTIAEEAGVLMPLYKGVTTARGDFAKGLSQLVETWGWNTAVELMRAKTRIQSELKPYVEALIGQEIDFSNPTGKPYGFLVAWEREVGERIKDVRSWWPNSTNPISLDRIIVRAIEEGREDQITEAIEFVVNHLKLAARVKTLIERIYGRELDIVYSQNDKEGIFDKIFNPIKLDLAGFARGRALSETIRNIQDNSRGGFLTDIMGMSADSTVNFLVTDRDIPQENIVEGYGGNSGIRVNYDASQDGYLIPLLFGDFSKATWLEFMVKAPEGESISFDMIITAEDGKELRIPIENVTDSWREIAIPIYGPYSVDWMSDEGRENWSWLSDEIWKGYIQGTLYEGKYTGDARGQRSIEEGDKWYFRQIAQAITGAEPTARDLEITEITDTFYTLQFGGNLYEFEDEISEVSDWSNIRSIKFEFEPGTEFIISGNVTGGSKRGYNGIYQIVAEEEVSSLNNLISMTNSPSASRPALINLSDGRQVIVLEAFISRTMLTSTPKVRFIDPSYGIITIEMEGAEFEKLWNGGSVQWLE